MGLLATIRASASALTAQRLRMDLIANNVANINTTRTEAGGPYKRLQPVFIPDRPQRSFLTSFRAAMGGQLPQPQGVLVSRIQEDATPTRRVLDPGHPDADAQGFVEYPNVDLVQEMTDMLGATRAYEANVTVMNAAKSMALRALDIGG
ncbi:MAG: flagellar basal body rod protein FlgC [Chloroflexi bacterium]|nr:flagellar basal body rod protein FlgC [Chloroflexota bacterium]